MLAIGVGGADAVDAMTGTPWELKAPQIVGKLIRQHEVLIMVDFVFGRYTFNRKIERMGDTERFNFASCWKTDRSG
jgi:hypothetical protein